MKTMIRLFILITIALVCFTACSPNLPQTSNSLDPNVDNKETQPASEVVNGSEKEPKEEPKEVPKESPKEIESISNQEFLTMIKQEINIGMNPLQVENLLGTYYQVVPGSPNENNIWRYDFGKNDSYTPDKLSDVDQKGLLNGDIQVQLFIQWDNDSKISAYSVYHTNEDGILSYKVNPSGEILVTPIVEQILN